MTLPMVSPFFLALSSSGVTPSSWMLVPFGVTLLAIALGPFLAPKSWEKSYPYGVLALTFFSCAYYTFWIQRPEHLVKVFKEYSSFVAIMVGLYTVTSGIYLRLPGKTNPWRNTLLLAAGAVLSNLIGTTGASMLLIREWIRSNQARICPYHIVFFIFIVSNIGGGLTPIGDPPLFLGYLEGVPFFWTLRALWQPWLIAMGILLTLFYVVDWSYTRKVHDGIELVTLERVGDKPLQSDKLLTGKRNLFFLGMVIGSIFLPSPWQQLGMFAAALGSYCVTPKRVHQANQFSWHPLHEVAWLFLAIFATMAPALDYLAAHAGHLGIDSSMKYYWFTGILSAALDNAPTYLTFLALSTSASNLSASEAITSQQELMRAYIQLFPKDLMAISLGAVFFGAMTYIGNGPNFMVRAIAEQAGVRMPGFFGFILRYAIPILLPILVLISLIFFRGASSS